MATCLSCPQSNVQAMKAQNPYLYQGDVKELVRNGLWERFPEHEKLNLAGAATKRWCVKTKITFQNDGALSKL